MSNIVLFSASWLSLYDSLLNFLQITKALAKKSKNFLEKSLFFTTKAHNLTILMYLCIMYLMCNLQFVWKSEIVHI